MSATSKDSAAAKDSMGISVSAGQKAGHAHPTKTKPPLKPKPLSGPDLDVTAFVGLMRKLEPMFSDLSNDQVRFVQLCLQRYQHEHEGVVKTKLGPPKLTKCKINRPKPSNAIAVPLPHLHGDAFLERLTYSASEEDVVREIEAISDSAAEALATSLELRSATPLEARQKLLETVLTLRQMSRIQHAGKSQTKK